MKRAAVIPSKGIGDALLMMIASHQLLLQGYEVTTFHGALRELAAWFPGHRFADRPPLQELSAFDFALIENDNSPEVLSLKNPKASIFYPTYKEGKHPPLSPIDQVFDADLSMADNIAEAMRVLLNLEKPSKENGLTPPKGLVHRLYLHRIVIHAGSSEAQKNWPLEKFLEVSRGLKRRGFYPVFAIEEREKEKWTALQKEELVFLKNLEELATLIYESGAFIGNDSLLGHLASNLNIPTLTISDDQKRMQLWRPGWLQGAVVTPQRWVPNFKPLRLRKKKWQAFVSSRRVLSVFKDILSSN